MRPIALLALLILVSACTSPSRELSGATDTERLDSNSIESSRSSIDPGDPSQGPAGAQESTAPFGPSLFTLEASVPLVSWNSEERRYELRLVDPATGKMVSDREPIYITKNTSFAPTIALSSDGGRLAVVTGVGSACEASGIGSACWPIAEVLRLIELQTGRVVTADIPTNPPARGWVGPLAFSRDGGRLAMAYHDRTGSSALLFDVETGQLISQQGLAIRPRLMEFSPDGSWLVMYGSPLAEIPDFSQPDPPSVMLLDGDTLEIRWSHRIPDILDGTWCREECEIDRVTNSETGRFVSFSPAVVFSPEQGRLHIVQADADRLTTIDFQERSVRSLEIGPAPTWIERLLSLTAGVAEAKFWPEGGRKSAVLSLDGTLLYVIGETWDLSRDASGDWHGTATPLGLTVIEADTGHELAAEEFDAAWIRISPDGRYLILGKWEQGLISDVLRADSLKLRGRIDGWDVLSSRRLDGQPVVLLASWTDESPTAPTLFSMLELEPFEVVTPWSVSGEAFWATTP